ILKLARRYWLENPACIDVVDKRGLGEVFGWGLFFCATKSLFKGAKDTISNRVEFQCIEKFGHQVSIRVGQSSVGNLNRQLQIRDEGVEFAVSFDIVEVFTQCGSLFTPYGINIVQDTFETAIFIEPSGGKAGTNPRYPG